MSTKLFENQMTGIFLLGLLLKSGRNINISEIEKLIIKYINNWATCDTMSSEVIARRIKNHSAEINTLYAWSNSENIWLRRSVLVTVVKLKNKIKELDKKLLLNVHSLFIKEKEPIVKKAVYWLEKEVNEYYD